MNKNNYCVIMAGGVGSRFWPYSRNHRPKQFLDFFGTGRSLLQQTVDRFRPIVPIENVIIVTNVLYRDLILEQVPDLKRDQILCEPARRNTAPCIAYAISHISGRAKTANIVVAASDHLIMQEAEFQRVITAGLEFVENHDVLLTLGMKPTRPETGYGYIQKVEDGGDSYPSVCEQTAALRSSERAGGSFFGRSPYSAKRGCSIPSPLTEGSSCPISPVKTFTEKPNAELAKVFFESGEFLWNSGIFLWNLQTIRRAFRMHQPDIADVFLAGESKMGTDQEEEYIARVFPTLPSLSVDYGIMEKADNVYVMEASFGWSDLGTWGSLYSLSEKDKDGNASLKSDALFYHSHDNIVTLEPGKLAVINGLDGYIVAESDGVLLICKQQEEQFIRQMVTDAEIKYEGRFN